jgi:adhesin transport system membrane fusion protein
MRALDGTFANDVHAAMDVQGGRSPLPLLTAILLALLAAGVWAHFAILDEVTRGQGRVIPSSHVQVVQPLEGGIVKAIEVREGQRVEKGTPLVRLDDTNFSSSHGELQQKHMALAARRARLIAETEGLEPKFDDLGIEPDIAANERVLFQARRSAFTQELSLARQQLTQRSLELQEAEVKLEEMKATIVFTHKELELARNLERQGAFPQMNLLKLERQARSEERDINVLLATRPRIRSAIREAKTKIEALQTTFHSQASQALVETLTGLAVAEEALKATRDRVRRSTLRSPVKGIINKLNVTTIGAVVRPGESVVEIVPIEDNLLVEARVRPQDVAFISPGQPASIKVTAYDYTIYGDLPGVVERIAADTIMDEEKKPYYRVILKTSKTQLGNAEEPLPIIPGMVVSADIRTGKKSVLHYLTRPLRTVRHQALRER